MAISTIDSTGLAAAGISQSNLGSVYQNNGPAFIAYKSSDSNISTATGTTVAYDTELYDTAGRYNNTGSTVNGIPAYSFMPNVAGYYQISASLDYEGSIGTLRALFSATGSNTFRLVDIQTSTTTIGTVSGSALMYFNGTTDYVYCSVYLNGSGQQKINGAQAVTWFSGCLVRAA